MTNGHKSNIRDVNASRPLWVRSRHAQRNSACPLYLRKRTKTDYDLQINRGADMSKVNAALIFAIAIVFVASSNTSVFAQPVSQGPPGLVFTPGSVVGRPIQSQCFKLFPNKAAIDSETRRCVNALSGNAQFWGCLFEDAAGRAEDQRTGLSCPARKAALAKLCQARCRDFASMRTTCSWEDSDWTGVFGDIGGFMFGSANVDGCGRLASGFRPFPSYGGHGWNGH